MQPTHFWFTRRRLGATGLIWLMFAHAGSAFAVSPRYAGFVSQSPAVYTAPPDVNVMVTVDDSASMRDETIPDDSDGIGESMWSRAWISTEMRDTFLLSSQVWRYYRSVSGNPLYYDPSIRYLPWPRTDNDAQLYPNALPTATCYQLAKLAVGGTPNPTQAQIISACGSGNIRDLVSRVVPTGKDNTNRDDETKGYWPATYFVFTGSGLLRNGNSSQAVNTNASWNKIEIRPTLPGSSTAATYAKATGRTDCAGSVGLNGCSYAEEIQNFANWFQYYRTRALMAKGAVAQAFARQGSNMRAGLATLHGPSRVIDGVSSAVIKRGVRKFQGPNRTSFFSALYGVDAGLNTPLRYAADQVGKYFSRTGPGNPWSEDPSNTSSAGTEYDCRKSFHILTTDGYWNKGDEDAMVSLGGPMTNVGNADNFTGYVAPGRGVGRSGTTFSDANPDKLTVNPFADAFSSTLSDYVAYYWRRDLRPDLPNNVAPSSRDPAYWQHLTTFTVGMGVSTNLASIDSQAKRDALILNKTPVGWADPVSTNVLENRATDLVHASMSGRGRFFLALKPNEFANDLAAALSEVTDQPLDFASIAADAPQVRANGHVYQATFNPAKWSGRLYAFQQAADGSIDNRPTDSNFANPTQRWEASNKMPTPDNRSIFTSAGTPGTGALFSWNAGGLTTAQKGHLNNDPNLLNYLRGDPTEEVANGGGRRDRARYKIGNVTGGVLGDIVGGSPLKGPDLGAGYDRLPGSNSGASSYVAFRLGSTLDQLRGTIFAAANDGMLHAFSASDGVERFAYVPNAVFNVPRSTTAGLAENKLAMLANPAYTHRFTVDGPPNIGDAYFDSAWHSMLVASFGAGARGIYALDVTKTLANATDFGASKIMWEFTDADDADMGFVTAYPHVVRMRNGSWAAIFGNGADSANGVSKLYIRDIKTRATIADFTLGTDTSGNNGLSQPNFVLNANREVIAIYAGDLKGNLWKVDVADVDPGNWSVAFGNKPLFSAIGPTGTSQPITVMPEITAHPQGGAVILFGTGKFFEASDTSSTSPPNVNLSTQSIYGIWDKPLETSGIAMTTASRTTVLQQQLAPTISPPSANATPHDFYGSSTTYIPNWTTQRGWFMDLGQGGERVNLAPQQIQRVLFAIANTPSSSPCSNGGQSRIFALNPVTGANFDFAVFDVDGSKTFDSNEVGLNVRLNRQGVLTQPIFQLTSQSSYSEAALSASPLPVYDRGQVSTAKPGGVELARAIPTPKSDLDCKQIMTAAQSDANLTQQSIQVCDKSSPLPAGRPRVSWRQIK